MSLMFSEKKFTYLSFFAVIKNYCLPAKQEIEFDAAINLLSLHVCIEMGTPVSDRI